MSEDTFKLIELKCKNCGANLVSLDNAIEIKCDYCHTIFKVEKKDYKQIGYDYESGRVQAQLDYYKTGVEVKEKAKKIDNTYNEINDKIIMTEDNDIVFSGVEDVQNATWKTQAIREALDQLDGCPYSKQDLKDELIYNGYTKEEAQCVVDSIM